MGRAHSDNLLEDPRVDPSDKNNDAISMACMNGHIDIVKLLFLQPQVDPSDNNNFAITRASESGHMEVVRLLLQDPRTDPSIENNYAISVASSSGRLNVVKLLVQSSKGDSKIANINVGICMASCNGHVDILKFLLQHPMADPSTDDNFSFKKAARVGRVEIVEILLSDPRSKLPDDLLIEYEAKIVCRETGELIRRHLSHRNVKSWEC